jgi:putative flippase GtrA
MLVRYGAVGLANTAVYLVLSGAMLAAGTPAAPASLIAWAAAAGLSFVVNRGWTFRSGSTPPYALVRFAIVQSASAGAITGGAVTLTAVSGIGPFVAELCMLPWIVGLAYVVNRRWVFGVSADDRRVEDRGPSDAA